MKTNFVTKELKFDMGEIRRTRSSPQQNTQMWYLRTIRVEPDCLAYFFVSDSQSKARSKRWISYFNIVQYYGGKMDFYNIRYGYFISLEYSYLRRS